MLDQIGKMLSTAIIANPIFVVGGSRSGTSVLVQALGKHKLIYSFKGENPYITDIGGMVYNLEFASESELAYYKNSLRISHDYIYDNLRRLSFESAFGKHYGLANLLRGIAQREFNPLSMKFWCAKTFPSDHVAKGLLRLYPAVRFILIHRNGIDVVHSRMQFHGFRDLDFRRQCEAWVYSAKKYTYMFNMENTIIVKHKDLIDDPHSVFKDIFSRLKMSYDPAPAEFTSTHQVHPLSSLTTAKDINVKERINQRPPAEDSWSPEQRQIFKEICSETMESLGYIMPF